MNYTDKSQIPKLTEKGFKIVKCPQDTWELILDAYRLLKPSEKEEKFEGKDFYIKGGETNLLDFGQLSNVKKRIHSDLLPMHQEWCGKEIEPSYIYGIRSYKKGATLKMHTDVVTTHHIASIIIVDKDLRCGCQNKEFADDWALDFQTHDGELHKVYAEVGDMIMYESAICEHGRTEPFQGTYFNNFFVHYKFKE